MVAQGWFVVRACGQGTEVLYLFNTARATPHTPLMVREFRAAAGPRKTPLAMLDSERAELQRQLDEKEAALSSLLAYIDRRFAGGPGKNIEGSQAQAGAPGCIRDDRTS